MIYDVRLPVSFALHSLLRGLTNANTERIASSPIADPFQANILGDSALIREEMCRARLCPEQGVLSHELNPGHCVDDLHLSTAKR
jgi:hypothetical protein